MLGRDKKRKGALQGAQAYLHSLKCMIVALVDVPAVLRSKKGSKVDLWDWVVGLRFGILSGFQGRSRKERGAVPSEETPKWGKNRGSKARWEIEFLPVRVNSGPPDDRESRTVKPGEKKESRLGSGGFEMLFCPNDARRKKYRIFHYRKDPRRREK